MCKTIGEEKKSIFLTSVLSLSSSLLLFLSWENYKCENKTNILGKPLKSGGTLHKKESKAKNMKYCNNCKSPIKEGEDMYIDGRIYCPQCWVYFVGNRERPIEEVGK